MIVSALILLWLFLGCGGSGQQNPPPKAETPIPEGTSDTTPPTVTGRIPASGATGIAVRATVTAPCSEALGPSSVTTSTFTLQGPGATLVPATVSYNSTTFTATLIPSSPLANNTLYTATVLGGASGVRDAAGNALTANVSWSFTTAAGPSWNISGTLGNGSGATVTLSGTASATVTANGAGNYSFTGLANGTYTVTPSKSGVIISPVGQTVTVNGGNVGSLNFTGGATNANLTVNGSQTFQTMDGMGVNINVNSWNGGQLAPALNLLVTTNGSSLIRVIRDPMDWVTSESLIPALHSLDPFTLQQVYETPKMQDIWNTIGFLNLIGVGGNHIILNFMGWTPTWLGGSGAFGSPSHISAGKEQQFATMVASLIYYGRKVRNLDFLLLTPLNESDWNCLEGPCVDASQYVTILRALIAELDTMGLSDVRLVGPDTASIGAGRGYISTMMADSLVAGRVDHFGEHIYDRSASPGTPFSSKNYWLTESAAACGSCDTGGAVTGGEWNFSRATTDYFLSDLANGFSGILVYDAYDSFYYHHNNFGFWGLLAFNQQTGIYTPRARFYANAQLNRFIRPGAVRIGVNNSIPGVTVVAFYHPLSGQVSIVGHNTGASPVTLNGLLQNLPIVVKSLALYQTNASLNLQQAADISVVGGAFSVSIPDDTFFSMAN